MSLGLVFPPPGLGVPGASGGGCVGTVEGRGAEGPDAARGGRKVQ